MRFKAVLIGALVKPFGSCDSLLPWQRFAMTQEECETLGQGVLRKLSPEERKTARIHVIECTEVLLTEIHTAAEPGLNGEVCFAIARHRGS